MNIQSLIIALLLCGGAFTAVHGRAIDDIDNSIEAINDDEQAQVSASSSSSAAGSGSLAGGSSQQRQQEPRNRFEEDWIKFVKAPPAKVLQALGSPVEIVCEVMGSQVPSVQWVVGHLPLSELDSLESNSISESSSSAIVRIRSVHVVDHMLSEPRTYTCVGRTGSKVVYASTTVYPQTDLKDLVQVHDKPFLGPHKPRITYSEKLHLDFVGSNVILPCKVHARPRAEVFWMNGEGKLVEQNHRIKVLPTGDLFISEIKWEDMGPYRCIARNSVGKDMAETFIYPVLKEEKRTDN